MAILKYFSIVLFAVLLFIPKVGFSQANDETIIKQYLDGNFVITNKEQKEEN